MYTVTIYYMYHMLFCFHLHITQFSFIHCSSSYAYNFITQNQIEFGVNLCYVFVSCQPYIIMYYYVYVHVYAEYYVYLYIWISHRGGPHASNITLS